MEVVPLTADRCVEAAAQWSDEFDALYGRLLWHLHTPYAKALVVLVHEDVVAVGCCMVQGSTGRITLMRTPLSATFASRTLADGGALHTALSNALIAHLEAEGCARIELVCDPAEKDRWGALGFAAHEPIIRYSGGKFFQATRDEVIHYETYHRMAMVHLDRQATGEDRGTLLMEHDYLSVVYAEGTRVRGFSLVLLGAGLALADAPDVGLELQRWIFPIQDYVLLPEGNAAHAHLLERSYTPTTTGVRMVRGSALPLRVEMVFAWPWDAV